MFSLTSPSKCNNPFPVFYIIFLIPGRYTGNLTIIRFSYVSLNRYTWTPLLFTCRCTSLFSLLFSISSAFLISLPLRCIHTTFFCETSFSFFALSNICWPTRVQFLRSFFYLLTAPFSACRYSSLNLLSNSPTHPPSELFFPKVDSSYLIFLAFSILSPCSITIGTFTFTFSFFSSNIVYIIHHFYHSPFISC